MRTLRMSGACRADIADCRYTWQDANHSARIHIVGQVRIMLIEEFNRHDMEFLFWLKQPPHRHPYLCPDPTLSATTRFRSHESSALKIWMPVDDFRFYFAYTIPMFDPNAHLPRPNRALIYWGACMIAGIRLAREKQVNVRVIPVSQAIEESVELAHEIFNRIYRRVPEPMNKIS